VRGTSPSRLPSGFIFPETNPIFAQIDPKYPPDLGSFSKPSRTRCREVIVAATEPHHKYGSRWVRFPKRTHRFLSRVSCPTHLFINTYNENSAKKRWVRLVEWHISFVPPSPAFVTSPPNCRAQCLSYRYCAVLPPNCRARGPRAVVVAFSPSNLESWTLCVQCSPVSSSPFHPSAFILHLLPQLYPSPNTLSSRIIDSRYKEREAIAPS
jgi:hypothetical protein